MVSEIIGLPDHFKRYEPFYEDTYAGQTWWFLREEYFLKYILTRLDIIFMDPTRYSRRVLRIPYWVVVISTLLDGFSYVGLLDNNLRDDLSAYRETLSYWKNKTDLHTSIEAAYRVGGFDASLILINELV